ncbi:hypothetical protein [Cellulomonas sp. B6]|uniref:hypothetical protein n=1 Tax=Cellulomonas sp. B6 TaxID=1295626 RepID=UPI00073CE559|nr:hypothetical protein [Cellulomonas sp. B6]KSW29238.1 hypothetical protein ATM99_09145 [Cellulomonas sp. B6]
MSPPPQYTDNHPAEAEGAAVLQQLFARLDAAEARCDAFTVRPGSVLEGDDRATAYDPISYQVRFLFIAAFDHANTFRRTLVDHGMPTVGAYPLVRASLESAAQVLWLTTGGTRKKRVFRALHRVWDEARLSDVALRHFAPERPSSLPKLRERLDELLDAARVGQRSLDRPHPSMTDVVTDAGRHLQSRRFKPIDVWRLCSSMAHGNRTVSLAVLESRLHGGVTDTGATYLMTTSYRVMAVFVEVVVVVIEAALDAQDRLNE